MTEINSENDFLKMIASKSFRSFEDFSEALDQYKKDFGEHFVTGKSTMHEVGTERRAILKYKRAEYHCSHFRDLSCPALFVLGCRKAELYVRNRYMIHNHILTPGVLSDDDDSEPYTVITDTSEKFWQVFTENEFNNYAEVQLLINKLLQNFGMMYTVKACQKWPDGDEVNGLEYLRYTYRCYHGGKHYRKEPPSGLGRLRSQRIGCKSVISFKSLDGKVKLRTINMEHNHEVSVRSAWQYKKMWTLSCASSSQSSPSISLMPRNFAPLSIPLTPSIISDASETLKLDESSLKRSKIDYQDSPHDEMSDVSSSINRILSYVADGNKRNLNYLIPLLTDVEDKMHIYTSTQNCAESENQKPVQPIVWPTSVVQNQTPEIRLKAIGTWSNTVVDNVIGKRILYHAYQKCKACTRYCTNNATEPWHSCAVCGLAYHEHCEAIQSSGHVVCSSCSCNAPLNICDGIKKE